MHEIYIQKKLFIPTQNVVQEKRRRNKNLSRIQVKIGKKMLREHLSILEKFRSAGPDRLYPKGSEGSVRCDLRIIEPFLSKILERGLVKNLCSSHLQKRKKNLLEQKKLRE